MKLTFIVAVATGFLLAMFVAFGGLLPGYGPDTFSITSQPKN